MPVKAGIQGILKTGCLDPGFRDCVEIKRMYVILSKAKDL